MKLLPAPHDSIRSVVSFVQRRLRGGSGAIVAILLGVAIGCGAPSVNSEPPKAMEASSQPEPEAERIGISGPIVWSKSSAPLSSVQIGEFSLPGQSAAIGSFGMNQERFRVDVPVAVSQDGEQHAIFHANLSGFAPAIMRIPVPAGVSEVTNVMLPMMQHELTPIGGEGAEVSRTFEFRGSTIEVTVSSLDGSALPSGLMLATAISPPGGRVGLLEVEGASDRAALVSGGMIHAVLQMMREDGSVEGADGIATVRVRLADTDMEDARAYNLGASGAWREVPSRTGEAGWVNVDKPVARSCISMSLGDEVECHGVLMSATAPGGSYPGVASDNRVEFWLPAGQEFSIPGLGKVLSPAEPGECLDAGEVSSSEVSCDSPSSRLYTLSAGETLSQVMGDPDIMPNPVPIDRSSYHAYDQCFAEGVIACPEFCESSDELGVGTVVDLDKCE